MVGAVSLLDTASLAGEEPEAWDMGWRGKSRSRNIQAPEGSADQRGVSGGRPPDRPASAPAGRQAGGVPPFTSRCPPGWRLPP